jgi:hypothetical protein
MLDGDDVHALPQGRGGLEVVGRLVLPDPVVDLDGVRLAGLLRWMEGDDLAVARIGGEVVGERRDAAVAGWVG